MGALFLMSLPRIRKNSHTEMKQGDGLCFRPHVYCTGTGRNIKFAWIKFAWIKYVWIKLRILELRRLQSFGIIVKKGAENTIDCLTNKSELFLFLTDKISDTEKNISLL